MRLGMLCDPKRLHPAPYERVTPPGGGIQASCAAAAVKPSAQEYVGWRLEDTCMGLLLGRESYAGPDPFMRS